MPFNPEGARRPRRERHRPNFGQNYQPHRPLDGIPVTIHGSIATEGVPGGRFGSAPPQGLVPSPQAVTRGGAPAVAAKRAP